MTAATMTLEQALNERRSVRGYTEQPVTQDVMNEVFSLANLAPSNCNIQPWKVFVASGAVRDELRRRMMEKVMAGVMVNPDFEHLPSFSGVYRQRQVDCAVELYGNMGIGRDDRAGRMRANLRNFELFDAPHVAFIGMEKTFGVTVGMDVGMYIQSLLLTMTAYGIGSCAQGSMRYYPDDVREIFGEPDTTGILCGISFGYEDKSVAANRTRVGRAPLAENVQFLDALE
ncbi:MAG: nitroreductase [Alcanivoracaceae bacterium]|nr:nitroreductase [Alcanivoracaceae bacterium]